MKTFTAALALAAGVSASYPVGGNVTYTTEIVTSYETYCPGPTTITYGQSTYTVSEATTLTITDCPCTVSKPVYTTSAPPTEYPTETPVYPTVPPPATNYPNSTVATSTTVAPTGGVTPVPTEYPTAIPTAGAGKAAALSGAGILAAVAGLLL